MKMHTLLLKNALGVLFALVITLGAHSQTYNHDFQDGKVYLKFKDQVTLNIPVNADRSVDLDQAAFLQALSGNYDVTALSRPYDLNNDPKLLRTFMLEFSPFNKVDEVMYDLRQNPGIEYVEKVPLAYPDFVPNDSLYNYNFGAANWNWHLDVINAVQAWDVTTGDPDVNVAIVDNAVWIDHPDLTNKVYLSHDVTQPGNLNSNPPSGGNPAEWSHGTHCAGLAVAETNNGIGVASIGYNCSLIGVKASLSDPSNISHGYPGIQWAAAYGAHVISCSWGNPYFSQTEQNVITAAYNLGVVILAAAGNDNSSGPHYPSSYEHVISVASTDEDDIKTDFSNYSTTVDVCAPGGYGITGPNGLLSTTWDYTNFGYYDTYYGTSMSCPLTAGLCGLIISLNQDLTPDDVEAILESTCVNIDTLPGNSSWAGLLGAGRIDAYAAVGNTPFSPEAAFSTPLPYITPGTSIQFFDESIGVPEQWSWEFTGGNPNASYDQNPTVLYETEGVFNVSLYVQNEFGNNLLIMEDYITVTSTPVPWIQYSQSEDRPCVGETVVFTDESLYEPTGWLWEFDPATVTFVDGTSETSQIPHVVFDAPGNYDLTYTVTNANGSSFTVAEDAIFAEGIVLDYFEDFELGNTEDLTLTDGVRGRVTIDSRAASPESEFGLHFQGGTLIGGWTGGPTTTTPEQAWEVNTIFQAQADNCHVDATGIDGVGLTFDLRQTFSIGNKYSWFRVLVNGEQVSDIYGQSDFNPGTNEDPFAFREFDLSQYGNSNFSITFQSSCYLADGFNGLEGDNVFLDNIMISNTTSVEDPDGNTAGVLTYPNPVRDAINISAHGLGSTFSFKLLNTQAQVVLERRITGYQDGMVRKVSIPEFPGGVYILQLSGEKNMVNKKIIVE